MNDKLRKTLEARVRPFLDDDEQIDRVVVARRGNNPWVAAWSTMLRFPRIVAVTNKGIVVLQTRWLAKPTGVLARLPKGTRTGEPRFSMWAFAFPPLLPYRWIKVNGERLWILSGDVDEIPSQLW